MTKSGWGLILICCGDCMCVGSLWLIWDLYELAESNLSLHLCPTVSFGCSSYCRCSLHCPVLQLHSSCMLLRPSGIGPIFWCLSLSPGGLQCFGLFLCLECGDGGSMSCIQIEYGAVFVVYLSNGMIVFRSVWIGSNIHQYVHVLCGIVRYDWTCDGPVWWIWQWVLYLVVCSWQCGIWIRGWRVDWSIYVSIPLLFHICVGCLCMMLTCSQVSYVVSVSWT